MLPWAHANERPARLWRGYGILPVLGRHDEYGGGQQADLWISDYFRAAQPVSALLSSQVIRERSGDVRLEGKPGDPLERRSLAW